ncbi:hypothetical protein K8R20_00180 [bacterium]|nr:hypothetical protein [bacterium]
MSVLKKILPVLIFLLVVVVAWVGFSLYSQIIELDINPNAVNFTKPISATFDTEVLEDISTKTKESFPVSPQEFLRLNQVD